jgi:hypothetical protein
MRHRAAEMSLARMQGAPSYEHRANRKFGRFAVELRSDRGIPPGVILTPGKPVAKNEQQVEIGSVTRSTLRYAADHHRCANPLSDQRRKPGAQEIEAAGDAPVVVV